MKRPKLKDYKSYDGGYSQNLEYQKNLEKWADEVEQEILFQKVDIVDLGIELEKAKGEIKELKELLFITSSWKDEILVTHKLKKRIGKALNKK